MGCEFGQVTLHIWRDGNPCTLPSGRVEEKRLAFGFGGWGHASNFENEPHASTSWRGSEIWGLGCGVWVLGVGSWGLRFGVWSPNSRITSTAVGQGFRGQKLPFYDLAC